MLTRESECMGESDPHMCFFLVSDAMRTGGHYDKTQLRIIDGQQKIQEYDFPVDLFDPWDSDKIPQLENPEILEEMKRKYEIE